MRLIRLRRFRAEYSFSEGCTGLGIAEYGPHWRNGPTIAIWSLYEPRKISNKDAFIEIIKAIKSELEDDEQAIVQMHKYSERKRWHVPFKDQIKMQYQNKIRGQMHEVEQLALDATRRKTSIFERLET